MKQLAEFIFQKICSSIDMSSPKNIIRIEGFEELGLYRSVCELAACHWDGVQLIAKLSKLKYEQLEASDPYSANVMRNNGWVDFDDRMTYYRNIVPEEGDRLIVLLLGTDAVADKGGLNDFFAITPRFVDLTVGSHYHRLMGKHLRETVFGDDDKVRTICDRFFKTLFDCVPQNLSRVSAMMDKWEQAMLTPKELICELYKHLPEWNIPIIVDAIDKVSVDKYISGSYDQKVLKQASQFIQGKMFAKTNSKTLENTKKKFEKYREQSKKYAEEYPVGQAASSLDDLEARALAFISGDREEGIVHDLLYTDYSILFEILNYKEKRRKTNDKAVLLSGSPLVAFAEAMMQTLDQAREEDGFAGDSVRFQLTKIQLCGIPGVNGADDREELLKEAWRRISTFAGGAITFLSEESWENQDGDLIDLKCEPERFLDPDQTDKLYENNFITNATGTLHKIEFTVQVMQGEDGILAEQDYCWRVDPSEDWMTAFVHLLLPQSEENSYIPYATMNHMNSAFSVKDEDGFAYLIAHEKCVFPDGNESILSLMKHSVSAAADEQKEWVRFYKLGEKYVQFREGLLRNGFFATIGKEIPTFVNEYVDLASHIASSSIYTSQLKHCVKYFVNAFTMFSDRMPVSGDIYTYQAIVPPYHPASLEKLADRMLFVRAGIREWFSNKLDGKTFGATVDRLISLSRIHNGTDGFFQSANQILPCSKVFGYYTLYGDMRRSGGFVSSQDIMRREMVFDDDFDDAELKRLTSESKVLLRVIEQYIKTYPRSYEQLSISFVNPKDLQVVVAALHRFITDRQKTQAGAPFALELTIITPNEMSGARAYLSYWINNVFTSDDAIDIRAYLRFYDDERKMANLIPKETDLLFVFDALDTNKNASYAFRRQMDPHSDVMTDCRFPMVFKPTVSSAGANEHLIAITQRQFQASTAHTQVLHAIYDVPCDVEYDLFQSSVIHAGRSKTIKELQERSVWLICIDDAIDKHTVRTMYAKDTGIIGFTTGEGSYGQMNVAITCRPELKGDMLTRCKRRIQKMFKHRWSDDAITRAANHCLEKARELDGVSILRAMNPLNYDVNNFMAYLVADELCKVGKRPLHVLINMDSYRHWFRGNRGGDTRIPDFLLLSADIQPDKPLHFYATVIEAKLSSTAGISVYLPKAIEQVRQGSTILKEHFDPANRSIEHRYWLAQLYRAIVFLQTDMNYAENVFRDLTAQLNMMMENHYTIEWDSRILAMEIDSPSYVSKGTYEDVACWYVGQYAFQNILLQKDINEAAEFIEEMDIDEDENTSAEEREESYEHDDSPEADTHGQVETTPIDTSNETPVTEEHEHSGEEMPPAVENSDEGESTQQEEQENDGDPDEQEIVAIDEEETELPLDEVRVLIGKDKGSNPVYWEFGHPQLANRHLLITGGSGQGKTYAIQTFLLELAKQNISSVVFDYTDGFLPEKLESPFAQALSGRIEQHIAIFNKIPINPFRKQVISVAGFSTEEQSTLVAGRFAAIMKHVYGFGEQQNGALYQACKDGIDQYGANMNFQHLKQNLEAQSGTYAKTVLNKMRQLFDLDLFDVEKAFDWNHITARDGKVTVIQLTSLDREIQTVVTEMLMWDAWYSLVKTGDKNHPFVVVLDEAQNLSIADGSPAQKILQEGRKYGWSAWFATQFLKGALSSDEISRLQQAAETLFFKPSGEETTWVAQQLADGSLTAADWTDRIKRMQKGNCIVRGDRIKLNGVFGACPATLVKVSSFEDRH